MKTISEFNAWLSNNFVVVPGEPKAYYDKQPGIYKPAERHTYVAYRQGMILAVQSIDRKNTQQLAKQEEADELLLTVLADILMVQRGTLFGEKPVLAIRSPLQITTAEVDIFDETQDGIGKEDVEDGNVVIPTGFILDFSTGCYKKWLSVEIRRHLFFRCVIEGVDPALQEHLSSPQGAPIPYLNARVFAPVSGMVDPGHSHGLRDPGYIHGSITPTLQQIIDAALLTSSPPRHGMSDLDPLARAGSAANPLNATNYTALVKNGYKTEGEVAMAEQKRKDYLHNRRLPVTLGGGAKQIKPALCGFDRIKDI